ncbi:MAG: ComF family protein [Ruminococcaceae bacterium]|nr:ComF family protein [Oscillospiraceae bacterium]
MKLFLTRLLNLLFPLKCPLCGVLTDGDTPRLCPKCTETVAKEAVLPCPVCRNPAPLCTCLPTNIGDSFTVIGGRKHLCVGFYRPGETDSSLSRLVFSLKHTPDDGTARIFAGMLSRALLRHFLTAGEDMRTWTITYPPRTKEARRAAGLDQAQRIARLCAMQTGAAYADLFIRRGGREQKTLTGEERLQNASASLRLKPQACCVGKKIILLDDITTTGATLAACAELLRDAGAEAVFCSSVLKTGPHPHKKNKTKAADGPLWFQEI